MSQLGGLTDACGGSKFYPRRGRVSFTAWKSHPFDAPHFVSEMIQVRS